ncbi:MAG: LpxI family protein [Paracoccaceae bacterium]
MLAIMAGQGQLPAMLAASQEDTPLICALEAFQPEGIEADILFHIETLGTLLNDLKDRGVTQVCFAGAIRRPPVDPSRIDAATWPLVPVLQKAILAGDDSALRAMLGVFENAGFQVVGAHEVMPNLLPQSGVLSRVQPDDRATKDAARAAVVLAAMSDGDVGQACVVQSGQVLVVEGSFGTDWMLETLQNRPDGRDGGLLCKAPKVGQDRRMDLPAIGVDTVENAQRAGLDGIVIEADGVMVLDLPAVIDACDAADMLFWVQRPDA